MPSRALLRLVKSSPPFFAEIKDKSHGIEAELIVSFGEHFRQQQRTARNIVF